MLKKRGQSKFPEVWAARRRALRKIALTPFLGLAACGFRMRGTAEVPFKQIYVQGASGGVALDLKRHILAGTTAKVVDDPKLADAVIELTQERRERLILSLTGAGRVREFQLRYEIVFRVHDGKGAEFVPPTALLLTRDMSFSDAEVLAKEAEEQLLFRDMQADMVQQMLRQLSTANKPVSKVQ
jgi:LPS-assembly lipoprotein